jgi:hypothetical protein
MVTRACEHASGAGAGRCKRTMGSWGKVQCMTCCGSSGGTTKCGSKEWPPLEGVPSRSPSRVRTLDRATRRRRINYRMR